MTTDTIPTTGPQAATDDLPKQIFELGTSMMRALTPETMFTRVPAPRELCISCFDALCIDEEFVCPECNTRLRLPVGKRRDILCDVQQYGPPSERYFAVDRSTYDGEGRCNVIGRGATKRAAIRDLLIRLEEAGL